MDAGESEGLTPGLYELVVTAGLADELERIGDRLEVVADGLRPAEAADRLSWHLAKQLERALGAVPESERAEVGVGVARSLLRRLTQLVDRIDLQPDIPVDPPTVLRSILTIRPDGTPRPIDQPLIPLLDTTLLTNAPGEPRVGHQLGAEIDSATRLDVLMAFIRTSGIHPLLPALRRHCARGRPVRVLTTTYTGTTQRKALDLLVELGAEVRVSYDLSSTRLHAKAWLFERNSGFSTAYIGSSNLTHQAQQSGLEWNVRVSGARNPTVIDKVRAVFSSYWDNPEFRPYDPDEFDRHTAEHAPGGPAIYLSPVAITPLPFQEHLLEQLALARTRGLHRNLLVSATGTGKTVMAALDYARLRTQLQRDRLLFVAHRQEILDQSQATFRHALRRPDFGEQWIAGRRPRDFDHVFASVQTLHLADLTNLPPDHFDVVIVDEFHHAAARSYTRLLDHVRPRELLGLTATPERADGLPVLHWFDDRIAAELRLWDAIDQHHLSPFAYYGIHDGLDLRDVPWRRGRGYDAAGLTHLYTASDRWAQQVVREVIDHTDDLSALRGLGFCVSVEHARYMARVFNAAGIAAAAIWGDTPADERRRALRALADGDVNVLFSVDLFNEGLDVPAVNTLLMLRPTDSPTLFLQQLGRGLRRQPGKTVCTVLDFVGHHRSEFRFDRRLRALLGGTRREVEHQVESGFPFLPAGCHMELDRKSTEIVLASIRSAVPSRWDRKVAELAALQASGHPTSIATYLDHSGLDLDDLYTGNRSWSDLREAAGLPVAPDGPAETALRRAIGRLTHVDDTVRTVGWAELLTPPTPPDLGGPGPGAERARRLARMLVASLVDQVPKELLPKDASLAEGLSLLWRHPQVRAELIELLELLGQRTDHVGHDLRHHPDVPLRVHARYSRLEILAAFGYQTVQRTAERPEGVIRSRVGAWQTGVQWLADARADLFAFTLDKTDGAFSPTTRYRDYAISRDLVHWESQSVTRADSATGLRYRRHVEQGSTVHLFARLRQHDRAFWSLGPATYVRHDGERPMAITWRLTHPLPGDLYSRFAAAVA